ncbi:hypothetical protein [Haloarchaeobius sp. HRN-SO-5]|uniref:hypothetical protein n=1 Tax=Haloarchaeobius sp. HRN-SO-5 TaxID=3446118 RepID=UPI003EBA28B3
MNVRTLVGSTLVIVGILWIGFWAGSTGDPYHAYVHTGHQHVYYEASTVEARGPLDSPSTQSDLVETHTAWLDERGIDHPTVLSEADVRSDQRWLAETAADDGSVAINDSYRDGAASLAATDVVTVGGDWYRTALSNDTLRFDRTRFTSVAASLAISPSTLPDDDRRTVERVQRAEDRVLLSDPALPSQLLVHEDGSTVRIGRRFCHDCGFGGMGQTLATGTALVGLGPVAVGGFLLVSGLVRGPTTGAET